MGSHFFDALRVNRPAGWRWVVGTVFILTMWLIVGSVMSALVLPFIFFSNNGGEVDDIAGATEALTGLLAGVPSWLGLLFLLISFVPLFAGVVLAYKWFLRLPLRRAFTVNPKWSWGRTFYGLWLWAALLAGTVAISIVGGREFEFALNLTVFIPYLVVALLFFPVQTTAEELLFRGWFTQWLGSYVSSRWFVSVVSGALFALLHLSNPEAGENFLSSVLAWFMIGFVFTWVTIRDGGIELAVGAHLANNLLAGVVFPYEGSVLPAEGVIMLSSEGASFTTLLMVVSAVLFVVLTKPKKSEGLALDVENGENFYYKKEE
jgi:uncharacterized protein